MGVTDRSKLCVMFFLEYFIKGAWLPLLGLYMGSRYLNFSGFQQAWVFNAFAIASVTGMFFGGQLADRYVSQEKFLSASHLVGGLAMLGLAYTKSFWPFFGLMLLHCFFYVPTLSVANAIAFAHLEDARKDFGTLRLWGSVGWVAAAWPLVFIPIDWERVPAMAQAGGFLAWLGKALSTPKSGPAMEAALTGTFLVSGTAALILAAFSLLLPHTPPSTRQKGERFAPFEAIKLLAKPSILVLFIVTFFDSLVHYGYYFWTSRYLQSIGLPENWIAPAMSIGQVMEVVAMAMLGTLIKKLGWRKTLIFGILSQAIRFGVYAMGNRDLLWPVIAVNVVHGFAYACFFATVYIFVDEHFPSDIRTSAQGLFNLMILGISSFVSNFLWGGLGDLFSVNSTVDGRVLKVINYHHLFLVPFGISLLAAILLALCFHPSKEEPISPESKDEPLMAAT
ncbi:MFS transporter [Singulisphaera acidiphila]|uniref:Sugar phosphate permease n=1 Tax=Singulisphaera acidiphila (strain ATCC BAA-1392 / DSM 18658 / VKM B-2454 / MOB10) TaxID=886293 RepID=L0DMZ3_SINAD|nr:MFS transporter [Singulisphaera acidiphila]AGA30617.1 sugar phosphate permease [Singulisphaera acidiphila DSM 18658]